jgi:DNA replication protein DnaC
VVDAPTTTLPSATKTDDGWRVVTRCNQCRVEVVLDTPFEMPAEELWGEGIEEEEIGSTVQLGEPTELALKVAATLLLCDDCETRVRDAEERSRNSAAQRDRMQRSGLPPDLRDLRFADIWGGGKHDAAMVAALEWAEARNPRGLLFFGDVGVGKTRLAATAICKRLEHAPIRWISVPVLLAQINQAFGDEDRAIAVADLTGRRPLALDDLDKVNPSKWALSQLFTAIDSRVSAGAPLIVTTNLSPNRIADKLGDPIASRLVGYCSIYELDGADRRLKLRNRAETVEQPA